MESGFRSTLLFIWKESCVIARLFCICGIWMEMNSTETLESIENLKAENQILNEQVDMLTTCILEMSEMLYV